MKWEDELPYWEAAGFCVADAWEWFLCGYGVPDAIAHRDLGVVPDATLKALRHLGIPQTPQNYKRWKGLDERRIRRAIDRGFKNAKDFRPYEKAAIDADDVRCALGEIGRSVAPESVVRYHELRARGLETRQAIRWMDVPDISIESIVVLVTNKLSRSAAQEWQKLGLEVAELNSWLSVYPSIDVTTVGEWVAEGIGAYEASWFLSRGVENPDLAARWLKLASHLEVIEHWLKLESSTPELAKEWHEFSFAPEDAAEWIRIGMNPLQAEQWRKYGKTASDLEEWTQQQFDTEEAITWLSAHPRISALVARRRRDAGIKP